MTSELTATIGKVFEGDDYLHNSGHMYKVSDGKQAVEVMEWDDVASGDCPDSYILSNVANEDIPDGWLRGDILAAVQAAYKS